MRSNAFIHKIMMKNRKVYTSFKVKGRFYGGSSIEVAFQVPINSDYSK